MAGLPHGFPKSPPSPVPEGDEEATEGDVTVVRSTVIGGLSVRR